MISKRIWGAYLIIAIIGTIYCISNQYGGLPIYLLPLSYASSLLICRQLANRFTSLSVAILNTVCLIRYVIYPLILVIEKADGTYYTSISNDAIFLMIYEIIAVQIFLNFYIKKIDKHELTNSNSFSNSELGPFNKGLLLLVLPIGFLFPSLFSIFRFLGLQGGASVPGVIAVVFEMGMMVMYVYLLSFFSKRGNLVSFILSLTVAIGYIFLTMVSGENVRRWLFLWTGIPTVFALLKSYPQYKKAISTFSLIGIPLGIFFGSFAKFALSNISMSEFFQNFMGTEMLSEYFGGLNGLSYSMVHLANDVKASTITSTLTDLFGNMPIVSRFFNVEDYSTQFIYQSLIERKDLICPLLGQSFTHFGAIGAPLFSIIMAILAIEFEIIAKKSQNIYQFYASTMMCVVFSLFMCLNTMIILTHAWTLIIFLIIQRFNNKYIHS